MSDTTIPTVDVQVRTGGDWETIASVDAADIEQTDPFRTLTENATRPIRVRYTYVKKQEALRNDD